MKCTICGKEVVLSPSATERARRFGGSHHDYTVLFPNHSECVIRKRKAEAIELMRRLSKTTKDS